MNYLTLFEGKTLLNKLWSLFYLRAKLDLRLTKSYLFHWRRTEALDWARRAGSQEICQWMVRSWSLGDPSRKIIKKLGNCLGLGKKSKVTKMEQGLGYFGTMVITTSDLEPKGGPLKSKNLILSTRFYRNSLKFQVSATAMATAKTTKYHRSLSFTKTTCSTKNTCGKQQPGKTSPVP